MSNLLQRLEDRKMPTKDVAICLDLNLLAERDQAMAALAGANRNRANDDRMAGDSPAVTAARAAVADLDARIREASVIIRITGVDRTTYNRWISQCPPRKGVQESFNSSTFFMHAARHSGQYVDEHGEAHEMTEAEWDAIDERITDGEHDRIAKAVIAVNREAGGSEIPFSVSGSATTRDSFGISVSPETSGSRRAASTGGSPKKSTSKKPTSKAAASSE